MKPHICFVRNQEGLLVAYTTNTNHVQGFGFTWEAALANFCHYNRRNF